MDNKSIVKQLYQIDQLEEIEARFDKERETGGLAWAIETLANNVIYGRAMARLVRPLIHLHTQISEDEWMVALKSARALAVRELVTMGHWRCNSTSMLQNTVSQRESEALADFIRCSESWVAHPLPRTPGHRTRGGV